MALFKKLHESKCMAKGIDHARLHAAGTATDRSLQSGAGRGRAMHGGSNIVDDPVKTWRRSVARVNRALAAGLSCPGLQIDRCRATEQLHAGAAEAAADT
jgi:hypothetical protein